MPVIADSGGVPVSDTAPYTVIARIPWEADDSEGSNGQLAILNTHTSATMYFKWIPLSQTSQVFETTDAGVVLTATRGFDWQKLKPGTMLIGRSTVNGAVCARDLIVNLKEVTRRRF
jgi:hypothetical protein